jgi:hypothetical protein
MSFIIDQRDSDLEPLGDILLSQMRFAYDDGQRHLF